MSHQESMMTAKNLVEEMENLLKADLDFLSKLAPRELGILANSVKRLVDLEKKYTNTSRTYKPF
jgi:hypothetical protein